MTVTIKIVGDLRRFVDAETVEVCDTGCSLGTALDELIRLYPDVGSQLFDPQGRLHYASVLAARGRQLAWPADEGVFIEDGDELLLTRFHAGG